MKFAREGYPFIYIPAGFSLLSLTLGWWVAAALSAAFTLFFAWFFRDPERVVPADPNIIVAPADGRVISVVDMRGVLLEGVSNRVSIFMSPLDVHVNRMPVTGTIEDVQHKPGRFLAAYKDAAVEQNEQNALGIIDSEGRRIAVVQVAGLLARRIVCRVKRGDRLERGARFGLIMFGSRTDLYLPRGSNIEVSEGRKVKGGETIIGRFA